MPNEMELIDGYIEFCADQWAEVDRNFKHLNEPTRQNLPLIALKLFIDRGPTTLGRRFHKWEKPFLKEALVIMRQNLDQMWTILRANQEYRDEVSKYNRWLPHLKATRRQPPAGYNDLASAFAAAEFLMMISEGKIKRLKTEAEG